MKKSSGGYIILDMRTGLMDGTWSKENLTDAKRVLEFFAANYPDGDWVLVKRIGHCKGKGPGIPDALWAYDFAPQVYGPAKGV